MHSKIDPKILESTILYDVTITSKSNSMKNLTGHLIKCCFTDHVHAKKSSFEALKQHLLNLISNLYYCYRGEEEFIAYSRANTPDGISSYKKNDPNNPERITTYHLKKIIYILEENGYIQNIKGFNDTIRRQSRNSRMRATDKLIRLFKSYKITYKDIIMTPNKPTLVLKNSDKRKISYPPTKETKQMANDLNKYNKLLSKTTICVKGEEIPIAKLQRVFNNASFEQGGRFYGGRWQSCKSNYRETITINGHPTEELDYSCYHLRMLYNKEQLNPTDDLYEIPGYPREHVKLAINTSLNCISRRQAKNSILKQLREKDESTEMSYVNNLIKVVIQKHEPVSNYFFSAPWAILQYDDSCITSEIINEFTRCNQVVLPIHDSYIVEAKNTAKLNQLMKALYREKFKFDPIIVKKPKTSLEPAGRY